MNMRTKKERNRGKVRGRTRRDVDRKRWLSGLAALGCLAMLAGGARAGVRFDTGNHQYTNVNIAAETQAMTITGNVGHLGVPVYFEGTSEGPSFSGLRLHGQQGVAFVEAANATEMICRMEIRAEAGWAFDRADWKLDALAGPDGQVTFTAFDQDGLVIPLDGAGTFAFRHNGQNPFHASTDGGLAMTRLVIDSTVPIADLKQVSMNLVPVPTPGAAGLLVTGLGVQGLRRRSRV